MADPLEFVFSFRSPFAWIAARHVLPMVDPSVAIRWTPFFPLPTFENFGQPIVRAKVLHDAQDILRLCDAYDLPIGRPPVDELDWRTPHAAFVWADRAGHGPAFGRALFDERWAGGRAASSEEAVRGAATTVGLDPDEAWAAARDERLGAETTELVRRNFDERDVFGVPMFILPTGEYFWGHDRMEWAIRHGFVPGVAA